MLLRLAFLLLACSGVLLSGGSACVQAGKENGLLKVVLIRHAEKPPNGDHLSCQGLNRALALSGALYPMIGRPDFVYVPTIPAGQSTNHARMLETIAPFAIKYNLTISNNFDESNVSGLAEDILKKKGTVLVIWEHKSIESIARALGVTDHHLSWDSDDYDSIWIIDFSNGTAHLEKKREGLTPRTRGFECCSSGMLRERRRIITGRLRARQPHRA